MKSRRVPKAPSRESKSAARKPQASPDRDPRAATGPGALDGLRALAQQAGNAAVDRLVAQRDSGRDGAPLESEIASKLGQSYRVDLHDVRIVDDTASHAAASTLGATAFAADDTVFMGDRAPAKSTPERERLLAHELAHVAQQQQASSLRYGAVSTHGDAHERAADAAASAALAGRASPVATPASPAAVQRQDDTMSVTKKNVLSRAEAQKILEDYFSRIPQKPGSSGIRMTDKVKRDISKIGLALQDSATVLKIDAFLGSNMLSTTPAALAQRIAALLPEEIDPAAMAHLRDTQYDNPAPGAPESTRLGRLGDLAKSTAPEIGADAQEQQWKFDQNASNVRERDKPVLGPLKTITPSIDIERLINIGKGLPGAWKGEKKPEVTANTFASVAEAVAKLSPTSLVPKAFQGKKEADSYANAQTLAESLARDLDIAQKKNQYTVKIDIGENYRRVDDLPDIIDEVERIVHLVAQALPHHASKVGEVEVWVGTLRLRVVRLGGH